MTCYLKCVLSEPVFQDSIAQSLPFYPFWILDAVVGILIVVTERHNGGVLFSVRLSLGEGGHWFLTWAAQRNKVRLFLCVLC